MNDTNTSLFLKKIKVVGECKLHALAIFTFLKECNSWGRDGLLFPQELHSYRNVINALKNVNIAFG